MWTRKAVKSQAKATLKRSYWKSVLVSFLLSILMGSSMGMNFGSSLQYHFPSATQVEIEDAGDVAVYNQAMDGDLEQEIQVEMPENAKIASIIVFTISFFLIFVLVMGICVILDVFIMNPMQVGGIRFFVRNQTSDAQVKNVMHAFDRGWKNITKTMFFYDLYRFLWFLLLIIPGIVKSYEYRMIPYILAEDAELETEQVFARSRQMMKGNKWAAFKLDLSFLGWDLLNMISLGILGVFYVMPYKDNANAALYLMIKQEMGENDGIYNTGC